MSQIRPHHRDVKHVLRKALVADPYFVAKYSFSPYQACAHGCRYCDGRAEKYWIDGAFDRDIVVRQNAPEVLGRELTRLRERGTVFVGSGVSDAYQPTEASARLMPECARHLAACRMPASVLTKSRLICRDLDLWSDVNARAGFTLMMSLATLDDDLRRLAEPGASSVRARLQTLRAFKARGCVVGVAAMPLLPFLSDGDAQLEQLASVLSDIGVDFVMPGGLTLRPGRQKDEYFAMLRASYPDLVPRYEMLYAENRQSGAPLTSRAETLLRRAEDAFARAGIPTRLPHAVYRQRLPLYDEIDILLQQMSWQFRRAGTNTARLDAARQRYHTWLLERKATFNRHRRERQDDVERELAGMASRADWAAWVGNLKLSRFLREVIVDRRVFDGRRLQLVDAAARAPVSEGSSLLP